MEKDELYGRAFYACFANGGIREEHYPFDFLNEYELVETEAVEAFLGGKNDFYSSRSTAGRRFVEKEVFDEIYAEYQKAGLRGEKFIHDKLKLTGNQQIYYATVNIQGRREAGKLGEYGKWYRVEFEREGAYSCRVQDYSAPPEEMSQEESYRCNITAISKEEDDSLRELFKVYPDGRHIWEGEAKRQERTEGLGTLQIGVPVDSIVVWHCIMSYYLCVEFYDANNLPIGLFDMAFHAFVYNNYSDQNMPPGGNWGNRVPITVILSHFHDDHISGLLRMVNSHNVGITRTYHFFFSNMDLYLPDTYQPPSFNRIINTVAGAGGNVTIYNDQAPFQAPNPAFDYGLASFDHPRYGTYSTHPHLHGMYVRCQTTGGTDVLMVGDTVYRSIQNVGGGLNQMPHQGDLAVPYDVLIACHHGGNYAVSIAGANYLPNVGRDDYIPIPGNNPVVIYSSNGNGTGNHPHPTVVAEHQNMGWTAGVITNANYSTYGNIPGHIIINQANGFVEIT